MWFIGKYHVPVFFNIKTEVDGRLFDSIGESERYIVLRDRQAEGLISNLRCQVSYTLGVNGMNCGRYIADFVYNKGEREIVEDFKGFVTDLYKLKKKLVKAIHNVEIIEVYRSYAP